MIRADHIDSPLTNTGPDSIHIHRLRQRWLADILGPIRLGETLTGEVAVEGVRLDVDRPPARLSLRAKS